jgi:aspartyl-tRNA(Asn)/glutamyl-tRNA(Gln) amidotransferase subunit C
MAVDEKTVAEVAHLARLQIDDSRVSEYAVEMSGVLALAETMNDIDTSEVEPMAHPTHAVQRLREDVVTESNQREAFQRCAPSVEEGYYLVPQVIE